MGRLTITRPVLFGTLLIAAMSPQWVTTRATDVAVRDRSNAYASVAASGQFAALTWGASTREGVTDVHVAISRDGGRTFGAPTRVNRTIGGASLSGEQPPRVALIPRSGHEPSIVVVWTAKAPGGTQLLSARSDDAGKSFAGQRPLPGSEAPGNRGWESLATDAEGNVVALWLDHRELAIGGPRSAAMDHRAHQHAASPAADGVARAQLSKLFFGRLSSPDSARAITGGVCYCCKTSIAAGADGAVYAAWRHVYAGNVRDVALSMSADGGGTFSSPIRVSNDNWVLDGCPENGPALAVDAARRIHVVWATQVDGASPTSSPTLALFYAMSENGRQFMPRQRIPTEGFPRHAQIALSARGEIAVVWDEQAGGIRRIASARGLVDGQGTPRLVRYPIDDRASASYPVVAFADNVPIVAWTSGSAAEARIRAERLPN